MASAAFNSVPQPAATTLAFSYGWFLCYGDLVSSLEHRCWGRGSPRSGSASGTGTASWGSWAGPPSWTWWSPPVSHPYINNSRPILAVVVSYVDVNLFPPTTAESKYRLENSYFAFAKTNVHFSSFHSHWALLRINTLHVAPKRANFVERNQIICCWIWMVR